MCRVWEVWVCRVWGVWNVGVGGVECEVCGV